MPTEWLVLRLVCIVNAQLREKVKMTWLEIFETRVRCEALSDDQTGLDRHRHCARPPPTLQQVSSKLYDAV